MNFHNVKFEASYGLFSQIPPSTCPEIAIAGRSNVGKSSLINKLLARKSLARVSACLLYTSRTAMQKRNSCVRLYFVI